MNAQRAARAFGPAFRSSKRMKPLCANGKRGYMVRASVSAPWPED